jgi:MFS family permease
MKTRVSLLLRHLGVRLAAVQTVFSNRNLRKLEISWAAFNVAEYAFVIALGVLAFDRGGAVAVGLMALIRTLPAMASGPLLAVVTDRVPRQHMLTTGLAGRALASAGLFVAVGAGSPIGLIYLLAALDAAIGTSFWPAHTALLPELSRSRDELAASNAVASVVENSGLLVGPLAAGLVFFAFDTAAVFVAGSGVFGMGAALAATIVTDRQPVQGPGHRVRAELLDGLKVLRENRGPAVVIGLWTFESLLLGAIDVFTVVVAIDLLEIGDSGVGFLGAVNGAGGVIGAIAMTTFSRGNPFGRYLGWGLLLMGGGLLLAGVVPALLTVMIGFLLIGMAGGQIDIAAQTLLQRTVGEKHLGRVLGIFEGLYWGSLGIGGLLAGWLIAATSIVAAVVAGGGALVLVAVAARASLRRVDSSVAVPNARLEVLCGNTIFSLLPVPTLEHLARQAETMEVRPGVEVVRQNEPGDRIYLIEDGSATVEVDGLHVATLGPADVFGEIAPLRHLPRTATVRSTAVTKLLVLDGDEFAAAVASHTSSADAADAMVAGRLAGIGRARRGRGH